MTPNDRKVNSDIIVDVKYVYYVMLQRVTNKLWLWNGTKVTVIGKSCFMLCNLKSPKKYLVEFTVENEVLDELLGKLVSE